jgi:hypothetical protein
VALVTINFGENDAKAVPAKASEANDAPTSIAKRMVFLM